MIQMDEETKKKLAKVDKGIRIANGFRLGFLFLTFFDVLFLFWGDKFWGQARWLIVFRTYSYAILVWVIILMIISILVKFVFVAMHNHIVKNL
jgi:hypothetical protein